jgi:hypothetical protein
MARNFFCPILACASIFRFKKQSFARRVEPPKLGLSSQRFDIVGIFQVHTVNIESFSIH